jgi:hypothetical protein
MDKKKCPFSEKPGTLQKTKIPKCDLDQNALNPNILSQKAL